MDDKLVEAFVTQFLKDHDNVNIKLVPDSLEIAVYKTVLAGMIKLLLKTTEHIEVKFNMCGQPLVLTVKLEPVVTLPDPTPTPIDPAIPATQ